MGLFERWSGAAGYDKIYVHEHGAMLCEVADGAITKGDVETALNLTGDDITEQDAIVAKYQALSTDWERTKFLLKLENIMILVEAGHYNKAKAKTELGF